MRRFLSCRLSLLVVLSACLAAWPSAASAQGTPVGTSSARAAALSTMTRDIHGASSGTGASAQSASALSNVPGVPLILGNTYVTVYPASTAGAAVFSVYLRAGEAFHVGRGIPPYNWAMGLWGPGTTDIYVNPWLVEGALTGGIDFFGYQVPTTGIYYLVIFNGNSITQEAYLMTSIAAASRLSLQGPPSVTCAPGASAGPTARLTDYYTGAPRVAETVRVYTSSDGVTWPDYNSPTALIYTDINGYCSYTKPITAKTYFRLFYPANTDRDFNLAAVDQVFVVTPSTAVDNTPPVTDTDTLTNYTGSALIHITASDSGSGIATTYYRLDGALAVEGTSVSVTTAGTHNLEFWSVDKAGNEENPHWVVTFNVTAAAPSDTTPPSTTSDALASYVGSATVHLGAVDNAGGSGLAHVYYKIDSGVQREGTVVSVVGIGAHDVEFWSVDNAGNVENPHKTVNLTITTATPPPVTKQTTSLSIRSSATSARIGGSFILSGLVGPGPGMVGLGVHADVKKPGKTYWSYSSNRIVYSSGGEASWWYRYVLKRGMAKGTYYFKCVFNGNANFTPCTSGTVRIAVK